MTGFCFLFQDVFDFSFFDFQFASFFCSQFLPIKKNLKQQTPLCQHRRDTVSAFIQADVHRRGWLDPHEAVDGMGQKRLCFPKIMPDLVIDLYTTSLSLYTTLYLYMTFFKHIYHVLWYFNLREFLRMPLGLS